MKIAYYPGCVAQESAKELDMATRWVCRALGIELVEFPNFSCCGSGFIDEANKEHRQPGSAGRGFSRRHAG